jgi:uncharacterized membrane protein YecN with MAPEG domain
MEKDKGILILGIALIAVIFIFSNQISFIIVHLSPNDSDIFKGNWNDELNREIAILSNFIRYICCFMLGFLFNELWKVKKKK